MPNEGPETERHCYRFQRKKCTKLRHKKKHKYADHDIFSWAKQKTDLAVFLCRDYLGEFLRCAWPNKAVYRGPDGFK